MRYQGIVRYEHTSTRTANIKREMLSMIGWKLNSHVLLVQPLWKSGIFLKLNVPHDLSIPLQVNIYPGEMDIYVFPSKKYGYS